MRGEDIRDFMQPHYILLCVRANVEEVPANAIVPFFYDPAFQMHANSSRKRTGFLFCSANDRRASE